MPDEEFYPEIITHLQSPNFDNSKVFDLTILYGYHWILKWLIPRRSPPGEGILLTSAEHDNLNVFRILDEIFEDFDFRIRSLTKAVSFGSNSIVRYLLENGLQLNESRIKEDIYYSAIDDDHLDTFKILHSFWTISTEVCLVTAIVDESPDFLKYILENFPMDNINLSNVLDLAFITYDMEIIEIFLKRGVQAKKPIYISGENNSLMDLLTDYDHPFGIRN